MLLQILILFGSGFLFAYFWIKRRYEFWRSRNITQLEPVSFPFGNIQGVGSKYYFSVLLKNVYDKYKTSTPAMGMYLWVRPIIVIFDLDLVKNILTKDFNSFHDRGAYYNEKDDPLSAHLFSLEGNAWRNLRAKLTQTFTSGKIKMTFNTLNEISNEMVDQLNSVVKPKESVDLEMRDVVARFTTDVIGNVAFGLEINSLKNPNAEFREIGRKMLKPTALALMKMMLIGVFPGISKKLGFVLTNKDVTKFFMTSIRETIDYREKNKIERNDFLSLLIDLKNHGTTQPGKMDEPGEKLTFNELVAQCFIFFLGGFETSSSTMSFCLYELAQNQEIQDRLRNEINLAVEENDGKIDYEKLMGLEYLQMVIDETLRKYPVLDLLMRQSAEDYNIPGTDKIIPKGILTIIPIFSIQRDPNYFPDPDKFDPERFTLENKKNRHPMAHIPFGDGPRQCIGLRFGLMQTKIGLLQLLRNFKFSVCSKTTIPMKFLPSGQLLTPINDIWLKIERISK